MQGFAAVQDAGDAWQKFANLRLLLAYQMTTRQETQLHGQRNRQGREWQSAWELNGGSWARIAPRRADLMHDLNELYRRLPRCTIWISSMRASPG